MHRSKRNVIRSPHRRWRGDLEETSRPSAFAVLRLMTNSNIRRLHNGQIGRLFSLENTTGVGALLPICVGEIRAIAN